MDKFPYLSTLRDSFTVTFNNVLLFVPIILIMLFQVALIPFTLGINLTAGFSIKAVLMLITFGMASTVLTFIAYGWIFALLKRIVEKKKLKLYETFFEGLPLVWKYIKISLVVMLYFFGISIITMILIGLLSLIPVVGVVLLGISLFGEAVLFFVALCAFMYITPIIIIEKAGARKSLKLNYYFFMKHKGHTIKMALLAILLLFIASLPSLILQFESIMASFSGQVVQQQPSLTLSLLNQLLSIPLQIAFVVLTVFYTLAYLKIRKFSGNNSSK